MAYQVLARKWRPKRFADLIGQEHVIGALVNAIKQGRLHHAYLLTGTRGVGKTTIARILAKSLNCQSVVDGEPCCQCDICLQIDAGRFVDVLEIDAASNTGIDNIREVLDNAQYAPTVGQYKVYIIDEVHMLSKSAFNAMLKTLEEPPAHVKFILATTDPHKVPITVLSRCLQFVLRNLNTQQISRYLAYVLQEENITFEERALQLLGRAAAGSMRDALSLLDQSIALSAGIVEEEAVRLMLGAVDRQYLFELLYALAVSDSQQVLNKAKEISHRAVGFDNALNECAALLQEIAIIQAVPSSLSGDNPEYDSLQQLITLLNPEAIQLYYQCMIRGKSDLHLAPDEYAGFLMTLLRILSFAPISSKEIALDQSVKGTDLHNPHRRGTADLVEIPQQISDTEPDVPVMIEAVKKNTIAEKKTKLIAEESTIKEFSSIDQSSQREVSFKQDSKQESNPIFEDKEVTSISTSQEVEFLALNEKNWNTIVSNLTGQLGSASWLANHTAFVSLDNETLLLSLTSEADSYLTKERTEKLKHVLKTNFALAEIHFIPWQDDFKSVKQVNIEQKKQQLKLAVQYLENDIQAQEIKKIFGSDWLPESIQLI